MRKGLTVANTYNNEIQKLKEASYLIKPRPEEVHSSSESWYLPHNVVHHNNKARVVFNFSYEYQETILNRPSPLAELWTLHY